MCRIYYYSPERDYELSEIDLTGIAWATVDDEVDRYGEKYLDIKLPYCPSASQAQRIGRRIFALKRASFGAITTNLAGMAAWGRLYGTTKTEFDDVSQKVRFGAPRLNDQDGTVEVPVPYWPVLSPWNPAVDEADAPENIPALGYSSDVVTPDQPSSQVSITYPVAGTTEYRIAYSLSGTYTTIEANYRSYTDGLPDYWDAMTEGETFAWVAIDLYGQTADCRVRIFDEEEGSDFSDLLSGVVGADNTASAAPSTVTGGASADAFSAILNVTVKVDEIKVAGLRLKRRINAGAWSDISVQDARPEQEIVFSNSYSGGTGTVVEWSIAGLTSDGTPGAETTYSATITS